MNRQLTNEELGALLVTDKPVMSRHDKLMRLAELVRNYKGSNPDWGDRLYIFSNLEHQYESILAQMCHPASAFALAAADHKLQAAGLKRDDVLSAMKFFELTKDELHQFSCDCGGTITNQQMAQRIEHLAIK